MKAEGSYLCKGLCGTQRQGEKNIRLGDNGQPQAGDRILQADPGMRLCSMVMEEGSVMPLKYLQIAFFGTKVILFVSVCRLPEVVEADSKGKMYADSYV